MIALVSGGLVMPSRVVLAFVFLWASFALFYSFGGMEFMVSKEKVTLDLLQAGYFSGVTITTLGYGDITPAGPAKAVAVGEAVVGMALAGAFLAAFIRRYSR